MRSQALRSGLRWVRARPKMPACLPAGRAAIAEHTVAAARARRHRRARRRRRARRAPGAAAELSALKRTRRIQTVLLLGLATGFLGEKK